MPLPYNHDPSQLAALQEYKQRIRQTALYFEFENHEFLRRIVSVHLGSRMHDLAGTSIEPAQILKPPTAMLSIEFGPPQRPDNVRVVPVHVLLKNLARERLREYICDVSIPKAALTYESERLRNYTELELESVGYSGEIESRNPKRRVIRFTEEQWFNRDPIQSGDSRRIATFDLAIDQLKRKGTPFEGDYHGTLWDRVIADATVNGELLHAELPLLDVFAGH
jgi:hypothetical protein